MARKLRECARENRETNPIYRGRKCKVHAETDKDKCTGSVQFEEKYGWKWWEANSEERDAMIQKDETSAGKKKRKGSVRFWKWKGAEEHAAAYALRIQRTERTKLESEEYSRW
jgi:hypothetical protein